MLTVIRPSFEVVKEQTDIEENQNDDRDKN
jgi:hypothetical protein